jgi:hypothetical protein
MTWPMTAIRGEFFCAHDSVSQNQHNTMPHLVFIDSRMSNNDAEKAVVDSDKLVKVLFGGGPDERNEVGDLGELPSLHNIWDCPYLNKNIRTNDNGKTYAELACGWFPPQKDGSAAKPFRGTNATKALSHVAPGIECTDYAHYGIS